MFENPTGTRTPLAPVVSTGVIRRIAYIDTTTEESAYYSQSAQFVGDGESGSEMDSSTPSSPQLPITSKLDNLYLPNSLHGLSLSTNVPYSERKLMEQRAEILERRSPPEKQNSPATSNTSSVTFLSTSGMNHGISAEPKHQTKQLSKSAKRRLKKKQRQQTNSGQSCLKIPCIQSTSKFSTELESEDCVQASSSPVGNASLVRHLKQVLMEDVPRGVTVRFQEQGIRNLGNTCFLASAIQFLLGSSEFCWFLTKIGALSAHLDVHNYPIIFSLGNLVQSLCIKRFQMQKSDYRTGKLGAIIPDMLAPIVQKFQTRFHYQHHHHHQPQQQQQQHRIGDQDVQEFLLFILDQAERELLQLKQIYQDQIGESEDFTNENLDSDDAWTVVGKRNKLSVQRTTGSMESSIVSKIFGGVLQSEVKAAGMVASVTSNPFTILILDIVPQNINTIEDAMNLYTHKDSIPDYRVQGSHQTTIATKINLFKKLPRVLIICLKQYTYDHSGMEKAQKQVTFDSTLKFKRSWMVTGEHPVTYQLLATCNHHGLGKGGDHYTSNVVQRENIWLNFNDSAYDRIQRSEVLCSTPYLLLYGRL